MGHPVKNTANGHTSEGFLFSKMSRKCKEWQKIIHRHSFKVNTFRTESKFVQEPKKIYIQ